MPDGQYQNVYFPEGKVVEELKDVADSINSSFSALVSSVMEEATPHIKKGASQNKREITMTINVPLFGRGDDDGKDR